MTRDERTAHADRAGRVAAAMDVLADLAPDGDSPPDYAVREALDAALADVGGGGLDGVGSLLSDNKSQRMVIDILRDECKRLEKLLAKAQADLELEIRITDHESPEIARLRKALRAIIDTPRDRQYMKSLAREAMREV